MLCPWSWPRLVIVCVFFVLASVGYCVCVCVFCFGLGLVGYFVCCVLLYDCVCLNGKPPWPWSI